MNIKLIISALFISLFISSCEPDQDLITPDLDLIYKVKSTEILLRDNTWGFNDLVVDVKYEMMAIPLLANLTNEDGMVQPGKYTSLDIFGNDHRQNFYTYQFATAEIELDTTGIGEYHKFGYFNVLNRTEIRLNPDSTGLDIYKYRYSEEENLFIMTSDHLTNDKVNDAVNKMIENAIYSGKPNDIANAVVDNILNNEEIQASIQQLLYNLIHGEIEELAAQKITDWLFKLGIIKDNLTEDQVLEVVTGIINQLINDNIVDQVSQKLVDLILDSEIVKNIDGDILKQLIEIKIYELLIQLDKQINAIDKIELSIIRK